MIYMQNTDKDMLCDELLSQTISASEAETAADEDCQSDELFEHFSIVVD